MLEHRPLTIVARGLSFDGLAWGPADGPVVLALHGFPQRCTSWTGVARRLAAAGARVVAIDQRGYSPGARPLDVAAYRLPELVADVVAVIEELDGPVHLVGHDWGAVVGWQIVARHPGSVRSWTAVSTPNPSALEQVLAASPQQRERFGYMKLFRQEGVAEDALLGLRGAGLRRIWGESVSGAQATADLDFFAAPGVLTAALNWYRAMGRDDNDGIGPINVPTTFVWGSEDFAFGREAAEASGTFVDADYAFVELHGVSHWALDEAPDEVADAILARIQA